MDCQSEFRQPDEVSAADAVRHWDAAAEEFASFFADGEEQYHRDIINPCLLDVLGDVSGMTVLDLACGEGHFARGLAERTGGRVQVVGVDASENMLRIARDKIAREKSAGFSDCISFRLADAAHMPEVADDTFDVVVCNMALMDIKDYAAAVAEVARVLRPGGAFVFSILHPCFITPGSGWLRDDPDALGPESKTGWRVDNYHSRLVVVQPVKPGRMQSPTHCFHRTLEDYVRALREAGFVVTDLREPVPTPEQIAGDPGFGPDLKLSAFLVVKAANGGQP